jgi:hypothetical protein
VQKNQIAGSSMSLSGLANADGGIPGEVRLRR